ncbi:acyl-CoA dehydrogenase family protein [Mycobacterium syngnathidarum]
MMFDYTDEQKAFRAELRDYYSQAFDGTARLGLASDPDGSMMRRVAKQMSHDGWLGFGCPAEFGGRGGSAVEKFIFYDETLRAEVPFPVVAVNIIAPTLVELGTDEQRARFLPQIFAGDAFFCLGLSEPESGTDLASIRTFARRDGEDYVISGEKTWTSFANTADYCWLAVRTDPGSSSHEGISVIVVPMDAAGITVTRLDLINEHEIASVHYDDVRVPAANRVGAENAGWSVLMSMLSHERTTLAATGGTARLYDEVLEWAGRQRTADGVAPIERDWVRTNLARAHASLEALKLMSWSNISDANRAVHDAARVSATKVAGTEGMLDILSWLWEVVGQAGPFEAGGRTAELESRISHWYRFQLAMTFGGGANEIQRDIVATRGLGLPRSR